MQVLIILVLSTIGNALVITLILKFEYLRTIQNAFIFCLTLCDFLYGCTVIPTRILLDNVYHKNMSEASYEKWFAGCQTTVMFEVIAYYGDYFSIAAIALDRFLYRKYPFKYTEHMTKKKTASGIVGIITVSFSLSILCVLVPDNFSRGDVCLVWNFIQYRKFLLQHTDSYPTQHQWVITESFAASDCLIMLHNLIQ